MRHREELVIFIIFLLNKCQDLSIINTFFSSLFTGTILTPNLGIQQNLPVISRTNLSRQSMAINSELQSYLWTDLSSTHYIRPNRKQGWCNFPDVHRLVQELVVILPQPKYLWFLSRFPVIYSIGEQRLLSPIDLLMHTVHIYVLYTIQNS